MGKPRERKTVLVSGSSQLLWLKEQAREAPDTWETVVGTQFVFAQQTASMWLREHLMGCSGVMGALGERRELGDKMLDKNANEVKVMASITRLRYFQ